MSKKVRTIRISRGNGCFKVIKARRSSLLLDDYIKDINLNFEDYYIYKYTNKFRPVSKEDFIEFKYSHYMFFHKDLYSNVDINKWIDLISSHILYLTKPFPPIEYLNKITLF